MLGANKTLESSVTSNICQSSISHDSQKPDCSQSSSSPSRKQIFYKYFMDDYHDDSFTGGEFYDVPNEWEELTDDVTHGSRESEV